MAYEHIRITRDEPVRERHPRQYFPPNLRPDDPRGFGQRLGASLATAKGQIQEADTGGFDSRLLLKVNLREGAPLPELEAIGGISIVSQEDKTVVLAFATVDGLTEFEARLATLSQSGKATRENILFSIERFERWTPENRIGNALRAQGFPNRTTFVLDVELWPLENPQHRMQSLEAFRQWAQQQNIEVLDTLNQPSLMLLRVRSTQAQAGLILNHRDVRTVDLPPSVGISLQLLQADVNQFPDVPGHRMKPPGWLFSIAVLHKGILCCPQQSEMHKALWLLIVMLPTMRLPGTALLLRDLRCMEMLQSKSARGSLSRSYSFSQAGYSMMTAQTRPNLWKNA